MGFSGPDPADTDDGDDFEDPRPTPLTERFPSIPDDPDPDDDLTLVNSDASCEDCAHQPVCAIYNQFQQTIQQSFNDDSPGADEPPVDAERLAWVCELYDPEDDGDD